MNTRAQVLEEHHLKVEPATPQAVAMGVLEGLDGVADVEGFGERMHVRVVAPDLAACLSSMTAALAGRGVTVASVREVPASLEDVFIHKVQPV